MPYGSLLLSYGRAPLMLRMCSVDVADDVADVFR